MNNLIAMLISTLSVGLVIAETTDTLISDSEVVDSIFAEVHILHDVRQYKHQQYERVTNSSVEDFETPFHLHKEDITELQDKILTAYLTQIKI